MKQIEVADETYAKLLELANEMTSQDPRGTRMPHMFQIRDWKKVYDFGLNGDTHIWVGDYQEEIETLDEFKEYLESNGIESPENLEEMWGWDYEIADWIEEHCPGLRECSYSMVPEYTNCFLTAKAAEERPANKIAVIKGPISRTIPSAANGPTKVVAPNCFMPIAA